MSYLNETDDKTTDLVPVIQQRAIATIQGHIFSAKKSPRNINLAREKIKIACQRIGLAKNATYEFPKAGITIKDASIRLAEVLAQCWGNVDFGFIELSQTEGESYVESYCIDWENNISARKVFKVSHLRTKNTSQGKVYITLDDPNDIYQKIANEGARRLRSCILQIIPFDIKEEALEECKKTIRADLKNQPIAERIKNMQSKFAELGVSVILLERYLHHPISDTTTDEIIELSNIYNTLNDGGATISDYFSGEESKSAFEVKKEQDAMAPPSSETADNADNSVKHRGRPVGSKNKPKEQEPPTPQEPALKIPAPPPASVKDYQKIDEIIILENSLPALSVKSIRHHLHLDENLLASELSENDLKEYEKELLDEIRFLNSSGSNPTPQEN